MLGNLFKSKQKSKSQTTAPDWVKPYLEDSAQAYGTLDIPEVYGEDWQAGLNPMLSGAWESLYSNPAAMGLLGQMAAAGGMGTDALGMGLDTLGGLSDGFQFDQGVFDQTMNNLMPGLQGQYDAMTRDMSRDLNWNTLPGLDMMGAMAGAQGSTKLGQATDLATAMTGDRMADVGSSLYSNALNQAQNAGMAAGTQNLNAGMNIAGMYGDFANMGTNTLNNAFNMNQALLQNNLTAGTGMQGYAQQGVDADRMQFDMAQNNPWLYEGQRLANLGAIGQAFGQNSTTNTSSPGLGNVALQLGSAALGGGWNPWGSPSGGGIPGAGGVSFVPPSSPNPYQFGGMPNSYWSGMSF